MSMLNPIELLRMVSFITSDSDYFLEIAKHKNGSIRLQSLLGRSDYMDGFFLTSILRRFLHVMTDKNASRLVVRGLQVFADEKKDYMHKRLLIDALRLARDQHGHVALIDIITDLDSLYYKDKLFDLIAVNALSLSNDDYGNFVVQHVLGLNDSRCTRNIAVNLRGHCVDLSFEKYGSHVVEKLLKTEEWVAVDAVARELLGCGRDRMMSLARSDYGNLVLCETLIIMQDDIYWYEFWCLVNKLIPFLDFLRACPTSKKVATVLEKVFLDYFGFLLDLKNISIDDRDNILKSIVLEIVG